MKSIKGHRGFIIFLLNVLNGIGLITCGQARTRKLSNLLVNRHVVRNDYYRKRMPIALASLTSKIMERRSWKQAFQSRVENVNYS